MKGKIGIFLTVCLLGSPVMRAGDDNALELAQGILTGNFAPDDLRTQTLVPAAIGVVAAGAGIVFKNKVVEAPYVGDLLKQTAGALEVRADDLVEGTGLFVGINGLLGLWKNGPAQRDDFAQGTGAMLAKGRFFEPGVAKPHEVRDAVVRGGLGAVVGLPFLRNNLPTLLSNVLPSHDSTN